MGKMEQAKNCPTTNPPARTTTRPQNRAPEWESGPRLREVKLDLEGVKEDISHKISALVCMACF